MRTVLITLFAVGAFAQTGTMTIRETSGSTQTSRPITLGRPFKQGKFTGYPRPRINDITATP